MTKNNIHFWTNKKVLKRTTQILGMPGRFPGEQQKLLGRADKDFMENMR